MKPLSILLTFLAAAALPILAAEKPPKAKKLRHVVAFKFKDEAKKKQVDNAINAFRALKKTIPQIQQFEWGTNVSPEKHDKGFTHGFVLTFNSEKDRDTYLVHPDHEAFAKSLGPIIADVFVIDYWARD